MHVGLSLYAAPAVEPLSLDEAKDELRVNHGDDDALIRELLATAREEVEETAGVALITQTWDQVMDAFPWVIVLRRPPLQTVVSVSYLDDAGATQTLSSSVYLVDKVSQPARIFLPPGGSWPITAARLAVVTVRFTAGFGDAGTDVPRRYRTAVGMRLNYLYSLRRPDERPPIDPTEAERQLLNLPLLGA